MAGRAEVWSTGGFADRTGLGPTGDAVGVGHSPDAARAIRTDHRDALVDYIAAAAQHVGQAAYVVGALTER